MATDRIETLLDEQRRFPPPDTFTAPAHVRDITRYERARRDPEGYWADWAKQLEWKPDDILFSADLPKTRSGKIMRRLLKDIAEGRALGDTTTLADPAVVAKLRDQYESQET